MSDTYEASLHVSSPKGELMAAAHDDPAIDLAPRMEREMIELHQSVESLLPEPRNKVIQFICSCTGEGVSTIVREYAWMASARLGKSVLIIDANRDHGQRQYFDIANRYGWDDALSKDGNIDAAITRIGHSSLYVSCTSQHNSSTWHSHDPQVMRDFFQKVRERFDITLFDSPSLAKAPDSAALVRSVDGVVLVVEAERTRWPVAMAAKNKIVNNGGTIVGVVLNKRQNHIPGIIYSRL